MHQSMTGDILHDSMSRARVPCSIYASLRRSGRIIATISAGTGAEWARRLRIDTGIKWVIIELILNRC
jgi:hypothetical protein